MVVQKLNQWLSPWSLLLNLNNGSYIIAGSYLPFVISVHDFFFAYEFLCSGDGCSGFNIVVYLASILMAEHVQFSLVAFDLM